MSIVLSLAADFIDRLSNPSYGSLINEEYALKLGKLMEDDSFRETLAAEMQRVQDVDELTSYGWVWLLRWCRNNRIKPNDELLSLLMRQWSNVYIQGLIVDVATFEQENTTSLGQRTRELNNKWLLRIITDVISVQRTDEEPKSAYEKLNLRAAENLLIALLQLETTVAITGASYLLNRKWPGQNDLLVFFYARLNILDEETKARWIEEIAPPQVNG